MGVLSGIPTVFLRMPVDGGHPLFFIRYNCRMAFREEGVLAGRDHKVSAERAERVREKMVRLGDTIPPEYVRATEDLLQRGTSPGLTIEENHELEGREAFILNESKRREDTAPPSDAKKDAGRPAKAPQEKVAEKTARPERVQEFPATYLVGEVIELKRKNSPPLKVLEVRDGRNTERFTIKNFAGRDSWNAGDLIALERSAKGDAPRPLENLGQRGTYASESARRAYLIGNGRIMPEEVRTIESKLIDAGQDFITDEIKKLETKAEGDVRGIVHPDDPEFEKKFKHGESRVDWRGIKDVHITTIDPATAKDHDDALHARRVRGPNGKWFIEVGVHIADSSYFVPIDKNHEWYALFEEAKKRGYTLYTPGEAYTMQPKILSNDLCSLKQGQERLAFSTVFLLDPETGEIVESGVWQGESIIKSEGHLTYETAQKLHDSSVGLTAQEKTLRIGLRLLQKYADKSREIRKRRKPVTSFDKQELEIITDEFGEQLAGVKQNLRTNDLVEAWMVQDNEAKAQTLLKKAHENPELFFVLLRFHDPPKLKDVRLLAKIYGAQEIQDRIDEYVRAGEREDSDPEKPSFVNEVIYDLLEYAKTMELPGEEKSKEEVRKAVADDQHSYLRGATDAETEANIEKRFEKVRNDYREKMRGSVMGLLGTAKYTTDAREHFSLAKGAYTQGTSPIRRFADVIVHHLLKAALAGDPSLLGGLTIEELRETADYLNKRQRLIRQESLRAQQMWAVDHMLKQLPDGGAIEIKNARIRRIDDNEDARVAYVNIRLPNSPFAITMPVPLAAFSNLPKDDRDRHDLRNGTITVNITGGDVREGTLRMELVSASDMSIGRREKLDPNLVAEQKSQFVSEISRLKQEYADVLKDNRMLAREFTNVERAVDKMTEYIGGRALRKIAGDLASVSTGLFLDGVIEKRPARGRTRARTGAADTIATEADREKAIAAMESKLRAPAPRAINSEAEREALIEKMRRKLK